MIRSTQRQVAALVAGSVLLAFVLNFALMLVLRSLGDVPDHMPEHGPLKMLAQIYVAHPDMRDELLREAARSGFRVRVIPDSVIRACAPPAPRAGCTDDDFVPEMARERVGPDAWLALAWRPRPVRFLHRIGLIWFVALIGLPTLAISLWASRGVTLPLQRLTAQAERVDPETEVVPLKVEGTTEIRLLAEAFNRLILRLTRFATEQRRMLAAVSHDLRTPLTRLRLRADTIADPEIRGRMVRDVEGMQLLIDRALALLQAQDVGPARAQVDLSALAQTVADDMTDAGVPVTLGQLAPVNALCDAQMLTRALENLVENAAKYGGGGVLSVREANNEAVIEVADTGPGLSEADKTHAFEPWRRGDAARGGNGNGLGLAIVRAVMTALGGRVELADAVPRGLVARLVLKL
ncbi:MAG TPA: HAMP domain-containing sensor histidine kinase [Acetobacteraceae bacterium]|nr:HAMP domain-containing sensor histidine kinase [Acetobacteraceae bacterium]